METSQKNNPKPQSGKIGAEDLKQKLSTAILKAKANPRMAFIFLGIALALIFFFFNLFSSNERAGIKPHGLTMSTIPFSKEESDQSNLVGIKESIDPRDVWTSRVEDGVKASKSDLESSIKAISHESNLKLTEFGSQIESLKEIIKKQQEEMDVQKMDASIRLTDQSNTSTNTIHSPLKTIGVYTKDYGNKKNHKKYVTSGSFARAVLMTGVVVGTGTNSISNPEPIMLRLTDAGIFSKGKRTNQIKEAILIGDCSGDLSSERARCRLQTLSLENDKGEIIERNIQGWIVGEDGRNGIKGHVVDKSSDLLRMAMLNGVLGGMSQFLKNQSTSSVFPISPLSGQQNALTSSNALKGSIANGTGDAFSKMADFVMDRFNAMSPQIAIASGREVDVIFKNGVDLEGEHNSGQSSSFASNNSQKEEKKHDPRFDRYSKHGGDSFKDAMSQMDQGMDRDARSGGNL